MDATELSTTGGRGKPANVTPGSNAALDLPCEFQFSCYGLSFRAVARDCGDDPVIEFRGDAGPLPYSAENPDARRRLQALLRTLRRESPVPIAVSPDQHLIVSGAARAPAPLTALGAVQSTTRYLIGARGLVDLLRRQF